jgi:hypothetical protein
MSSFLQLASNEAVMVSTMLVEVDTGFSSLLDSPFVWAEKNGWQG